MKTIEELRSYLKKELPDTKIYLFGSRARGDNRANSDYDIAIESDKNLKSEIARINDIIETSNIPFKVDIVELSKAPYLKKIIKKEAILWH